MAKTPKKKTEKPKPSPEDLANLELDPKAWPKFERLVKRAGEMGPKPHKPKSEAGRD